MIEPIMYFGIGFLVAAILTIGLMPLVHARAVRLTTRRIEAAAPASMAEIQADKDQLRAEFAMSTRRLEISVEQLKTKTTGQLAEISKKTEAINLLKAELTEKTAAMAAFEAREKALQEQIRATEGVFQAKSSTLEEAERNLAAKRSELDQLSAQLSDRSGAAEGQQVELLALRAQVEALKGRVDYFERETQEIEQRLARERSQISESATDLDAERSKVAALQSRVAELERDIATRSGDTDGVGRRIQELENHLAEQGRLLAQHDYQTQRLQGELANARKVEADLRADLANIEGRHAAATEELQASKTHVENQTKSLLEERTRIKAEISALKRDAEATWATERVENALLRERINDVAAEVVRLTQTLEGGDSQIDTILASEQAVQPKPISEDTNKLLASVGAPPSSSGGTLADRIRALQGRTPPRVPVPST